MKITSPTSEEEIRKLRVGDEVEIYGTIYTARDKAHELLLNLIKENKTPEINLENHFIFHCGPIIDNNQVCAAGPTTSTRMNRMEPEVIKHYKVRGIIGKGGMDDNTRAAMKDVGCVYFLTTGASLLAKRLKVVGVYKPEFGMVEAIWELEANGLPAIVMMDSYGNNLHQEIYNNSRNNLEKLLRKV